MILRNRINKNYMTIPAEIVNAVVDENVSKNIAKEALYNHLKNNIRLGSIHTHDKIWLTTIMNWTEPNAGLDIMSVAKWIDFAKRIDKIDETKDDEQFDFSDEEVEMIFSKLRNPEFRVVHVTTSLLYFLEDLQDATGMKIDDGKKKKRED